MKKALFTGYLVLILALVTLHTVAAHQGNNQCNANNQTNCPVPTQVCNNGQAVGNPHCQPTVEPTVGTTVSPTYEVTPTQDVTPTLEVAPTETPSPTLEPTTPPSPHGDGLSDGRESGHANAPQPTLVPCRPGICGYK